jgi:hypothetical protein
VALGDVDGDGDLDAFVANYNQPNKVWENDGGGKFSDSSQSLGSSASYAVALGDVDGDGDLDALAANYNQPNKVWENDDAGNFSDSGQSLGSSSSFAVALGDVDGDGDLDAFVANYNNQPNKVWLYFYYCFADIDTDLDVDGMDLAAFANAYVTEYGSSQCSGFMDTGQSLGSSSSFAVALGDADDDDLDAFVVNSGQPNKVWISNFCLCDIDKDGDVDEQDLAVFASEYGRSDCAQPLTMATMDENVAFK